MRNIRPWGGVILFALLSLSLYAQRERRAVSLSLRQGINHFYGDVEKNLSYKTFKDDNMWSLGYGLDLHVRLKPYLFLRGSLEKGKLTGIKPNRNILFDADLWESSFGLSIDILNVFKNKHRRLNPYVGVGVGLLQYNSVLKKYPDNKEIAHKGFGHGKGINGMTSETEIPVFGGINIFLGQHIDIKIESNLHIVNSDELDVKKGGFRYDMYGFYSLGVTYHFTKKSGSRLPVRPESSSLATKTEEEKTATEEDKTLALEKTPQETAAQEKTDEATQAETKNIDKIMAEKERRVQPGKASFENVRFYVQVAASQKPIDRGIIAKSIGYPEKSVSVLKGNGWYKYVVGNYKQYWEAKNQRNILISKKNIQGAFVVATRNDGYISVKDLLADNSAQNVSYPLKKHTESGIVYSVQILAARNSAMAASGIKAIFNLDEDVYLEESDGLKRYTVGSFDNIVDAIELMRKVVDNGISDAFVVAYKDGKRVPLESISH